MRAASVLTVWAITRLVRHQCKVALVGLHDRGCFQIVLVEAMDDFIKSRDVLVEGSQVYVTSFPAVAIRVQRVFWSTKRPKSCDQLPSGAVASTNSYGPVMLSETARPWRSSP
jgi:hypothetical protein